MALEEVQLVIPLIAAAVAAVIGYIFNKAREIQVNIKQKKLERYDDLVGKLTVFVSNSTNRDKQQEFINAYYKAGAYASDEVLQKCDALLSALEQSDQVTNLEPFINEVYNAIRQDTEKGIFTKPKFDFKAFHVSTKTGTVVR
jgi:hypothetical protein